MDEPDHMQSLSATDPRSTYFADDFDFWFLANSRELPHYSASVSALSEGQVPYDLSFDGTHFNRSSPSLLPTATWYPTSSPELPQRGASASTLDEYRPPVLCDPLLDEPRFYEYYSHRVPKSEHNGRMATPVHSLNYSPRLLPDTASVLIPVNEYSKGPTSDGQWQCQLCGQSFSGEYRKGNLRRHIRFKHTGQSRSWVNISLKLLYGVAAGACALLDTGSRHNLISSALLDRLGIPLSAERATTLACIAGFTISTTCLYRSSLSDRYQDGWIILGIVSGVGIGLSVGLRLYDVVLRVLPWTVLLSLLMSGIMHGILRCRNAGKRLDEKVEHLDFVAGEKRQEYCDVLHKS